MLQYGPIINTSSNGNSKTLNPRNLSYKSTSNITTKNISSSITSTTTSVIKTTGNFTSASITDLTASSINNINDSLNPVLVFGANTAFSLLKSEYQTNNFKIYPILFTRNMLINNSKFILNTEQLSIKDNVIVINSTLNNINIIGNVSDQIISGIIFPISDNNLSTGYFAGLLYVPNFKIKPQSLNSTIYSWINEKYPYFTNKDKGFFKLKYLPENLNFSNFNNSMNQTYQNLLENNNNYSNLLVGSIGIADGELIAFNNEYLNIKISNGVTDSVTILGIDKTKITIYNNVDLIFNEKLLIKNNIDYLEFSNNNINILQNLNFSLINSYLNFNENLFITSKNEEYMKFDSMNKLIQFKKLTQFNNLNILETLLLSNIPLTFNNNLDFIGIDSNTNEEFKFITLNILENKIKLLKETNVDIITINTNLNLLPNSNLILSNNTSFIFTGQFYFKNNSNFILLNSTNNTINLLQQTNINKLTVTENITLLNNISLNIDKNFSIKTNKELINFSDQQNTFYNNLYFNTLNPEIVFDLDISGTKNILSIHGNKSNLKLNIGEDISITNKQDTGYDKINNNIYTTFEIINNSDYYYISGPPTKINTINKIYLMSGLTTTNIIPSNINFILKNVSTNYGHFSGKIIGTSFNIANNGFNRVSHYEIDFWTQHKNENSDIIDIVFEELRPIKNYYKSLWDISGLEIIYDSNTGITDLKIICQNTSTVDDVTWNLKVDILTI